MTTNQSLVLASGYSTADQPGIQAFLFDESTGKLTTSGSYIGINVPSFLIIHPNKRWVYAVSETGLSSHNISGEVWAFQMEQEPFLLKPINRQTSRGDWPCHLQLDETGKWLVTTNYGTGNTAIYPIQWDGSLGEMTDEVQHEGHGSHADRQESAHAHSSIFTPDNRFVIVADLGMDELVIYQFDSSTGKLLPHSSVHTRPGAGPRHLVFHPNGKWFYVANELASSVTFYEYGDANDMMIEKQTLSTIPSDAPENIVADIHISSDGKRLYVSNRGHNSIAAFDIGVDGSLSPVSISSCGGSWPRHFAISPTGQFILVANQYSNEICVLPIRKGKEALGSLITRVSLTGASCIQFA